MQVLITGKSIDIGEALRAHTEEKVRDLVSKYQLEPLDCTVTISRDGPYVRGEFDIHLGRDVRVRAHADSDDAHYSVDNGIEMLEKRIRKYKNRLVDHHKKRDVDFVKSPAQQYVLNAAEEQANSNSGGGDHPLIIAETKTHIPSLTVGEAVMMMDLRDEPTFVFHNEAHGRLNVVYRRKDGNVGWIDPEEE